MVTLRTATRLATERILAVYPRRSYTTTTAIKQNNIASIKGITSIARKQRKRKEDMRATAALPIKVGAKLKLFEPVYESRPQAARRAAQAKLDNVVINNKGRRSNNYHPQNTPRARKTHKVNNCSPHVYTDVQEFKIPKKDEAAIGSSFETTRFFCTVQTNSSDSSNSKVTASAYNAKTNTVAANWLYERDTQLASVNTFMSTLSSHDEVPDSYAGTIDQKQKNICNNLLLHETLKFMDIHGTQSATIFTLDTPQFSTCHYLTSPTRFQEWRRNISRKDDLYSTKFQNNPISADMIYVANPSFYKAELSKTIFGKRVNTFNTTANLLFQRLNQTSAAAGFNVMWLDYCCTWYGNDLCCPYNDVNYIFQHRILKTTTSTDYSVLMITLSKRVPYPNADTEFASPELEDYEPNQSLNHVLRDIPRLAQDHNQIAEFKTSRHYGQMLFVYFYVYNKQ